MSIPRIGVVTSGFADRSAVASSLTCPLLALQSLRDSAQPSSFRWMQGFHCLRDNAPAHEMIALANYSTPALHPHRPSSLVTSRPQTSTPPLTASRELPPLAPAPPPHSPPNLSPHGAAWIPSRRLLHLEPLQDDERTLPCHFRSRSGLPVAARTASGGIACSMAAHLFLDVAAGTCVPLTTPAVPLVGNDSYQLPGTDLLVAGLAAAETAAALSVYRWDDRREDLAPDRKLSDSLRAALAEALRGLQQPDAEAAGGPVPWSDCRYLSLWFRDGKQGGRRVLVRLNSDGAASELVAASDLIDNGEEGISMVPAAAGWDLVVEVDDSGSFIAHYPRAGKATSARWDRQVPNDRRSRQPVATRCSL
ncbi:hypothetical protein DFJ73DRAFT_765259 [Zopfochytrium polystomum]|nr:hypothetical protein DFJ73DRAFT_765259 [Zopfochytrium polystomum]